MQADIEDAVDRVIEEAQTVSTLDTELGKLLGSPIHDDAEPGEESP